ncbi:MAG: sulfite exporter TauE/SafE family protein [Leptolyngbya sp. SIO1E4]|nr:sulfite exporter TauE/SafE family protein [Leptolyngbya sp. SIO1E4]
MQQTLILAHLDHASRLSGLLTPDLTVGTMAAGIAIAFALGAAHAFSPGHGKTLVTAYLIGSRGTPEQALLLGATTTVTHTLGVFALGLVALFASQYILPEQLYPILSLLSGLTICVVGFKLLQTRLGYPEHSLHSHEGHDHDHDSESHHHHHGHTHSHSHSHSDLASLITVGISGGLVPCPSALVLLLSAVALHQITYGLILVSGFSLGLASVLTLLGLIAVYAGQWLEKLPIADSWVKRVSILSAAATVCIGISLTTVSMMS